MQHKQIRRNDLQDDDGLNDGFNTSVNYQVDPSLPSTVPDWYASSSLEGEDGILNDDDENTHPSEVEERPDIDQSALSTIGQLKNTLPDIPGHGEVSQESTKN